MQVASFMMSVISAQQQVKAGEQQQEMYSQQAAQATIQGRTQAINYKQQAADVLRRMNETLATTVARAGQFGDAISGSALALQKFAESEGSREFGTSTDNASLALAGAAAQAKIYMQAGGIALTTAKVGAATTLGQGFQRLADSAKGAAGP
tara:strand:+ start:137 stop:589 length:453 start_codon:yes stop_codon:yes gene_type:complete